MMKSQAPVLTALFNQTIKAMHTPSSGCWRDWRVKRCTPPAQMLCLGYLSVERDTVQVLGKGSKGSELPFVGSPQPSSDAVVQNRQLPVAQACRADSIV